ncbi:unnamed protein product [Microthlaspi erraticum]|uniref:RRM domain-containing protein n=1 Tax=Microthlaspi erraticum TaxID=1685480 RepID=A0A6D2IL71_9BRAS|nr:unnamed protein product [Microthlaspi erraticum]
MGHKRLRDDEGDVLRDDEGDVRVRSEFPITCSSCLNPCVRKSWSEDALIRRARLGFSQESFIPAAHEMPTHPSGLDDPFANPSGLRNLVPPEDKSIKTLVLRGDNLRYLEQDMREKFVSYGEIESIHVRSLALDDWAYVTYKTRQGAEKATQGLDDDWLVVNCQWLRLAWVRESHQDSLNQFVNVSQKLASSSDVPVLCDPCLSKKPKKKVARRPESGDHLVYKKETPRQERERHRQETLSRPDVAALHAEAGPCTLEPPKDKSVRTLLVRGLDESVLEQDVRDHFVAYADIQCVTMTYTHGWAWAFVNFTTRQAAEKAMQQLSEGLVIDGQRFQVTWAQPFFPEPDESSSNHDD